jgi:drug/metabolite transporter (DMT)-like permease
MVAIQDSLIVAPVTATFMRMLVSFVSLCVFTIFLQKQKEVLIPIMQNREDGIKFALAGALFGPCIGVSLSLYTITFIEATVAQTIFSLVPLVAAFISVIFFREKLRVVSVIATLVAVSGVLILIWRNEIMALLL